MRPAEGQRKTDVWKGMYLEGRLSLLPRGVLGPAATFHLPEDDPEVSALTQS